MPTRKCDGCGRKDADRCVHIQITLSHPIHVTKETTVEEIYVCGDCVEKVHKLAKHVVKDTVKEMIKNTGH